MRLAAGPPSRTAPPATADNTPPLLARPPKKPAIIDPAPIVVTVPPRPGRRTRAATGTTAGTRGTAAARHGPRLTRSGPPSQQDSHTGHNNHTDHSDPERDSASHTLPPPGPLRGRRARSGAAATAARRSSGFGSGSS